MKLSRCPAALGRFELRRQTDLPQVGWLASAVTSRLGPSPLPMLARHEYRARARNKWAVRRGPRRWGGKLKSPAARQAKSRSARLPVRHLVRYPIVAGFPEGSVEQRPPDGPEAPSQAERCLGDRVRLQLRAANANLPCSTWRSTVSSAAAISSACKSRRHYSEVESCCKHSLIIWTTAWGPTVPTAFAVPCSVTVRM